MILSFPTILRFSSRLHLMVAGMGLFASLAGGVHASSWPMRQRDATNTGRADFSVPANRMNSTFFDAIRWQKPSPGFPDEGSLGSSSMVFFDGVGPVGADLVAGGYHWPKGVQGMDRHDGRLFWAGNPDGGESIGENTPAFSPDGSTLYVVNDATNPERPLMAFATAAGPSFYRHNGNDVTPGKLSAPSPKVGPDGRIYTHQWNDRPHAAADNGTGLSLAWSAQSGLGACYSGPAAWQDAGRLLVVSGGRDGQVKAWDGTTGDELWSVAMPSATDADPTIDPANGNVYLPVGFDDVWIAGLDKNGNPLWDSAVRQVFDWQSGTNDPQRAQSAGCLSHDGLTYYFQTVDQIGQGKLYAVNTTDGSLKWNHATGSRGWESSMSSPIVTPNGVIIVGSNDGGAYHALLDGGGGASLLDSLVVSAPGNARNSATLSPDGLLYLSGRWLWTKGNGDGDVPSEQVGNLFTAFDLNAGALGPVAPEITSHPTPSQSINSGATAILTAAVGGSPVPSLQWYRGSTGDTSNPIPGAISDTLTTPVLLLTSSFWVRATNSLGSADSDTAVVNVTPVPVTLVDIVNILAGNQVVISSSPLDVGGVAEIFDGNVGTLARSQAVNPLVVTLEFQQAFQLARSRIHFSSGLNRWRVETADTLADLDGASGSFRVALDWLSGNESVWHDRLAAPGAPCRFVRLKLQRLTGDDYVHLNEWQLFAGTALPPMITMQPQSALLWPGEGLAPDALSVIASGSGPLTYQWAKFMGGQFFSGSIWYPLFPSQPQLDLGVVDGADEGIYQVAVSNTLGGVRSEEIIVGVNGVALSEQEPEPLWSSLEISLEPPGVAGGWRFEGELEWHVSGEPVPGLSPGGRTVVYKPVEGFARPPDETWIAGDDMFITLTRQYEPSAPGDSGSITFFIEPPSLVSPALPDGARAQWRLSGESGWSESGTTRSGLAPGEYLIECRQLADRETPVPVRVVVREGETSDGRAAYPAPAPAPAASWNLLAFETVHSAAEPIPYACIGQIRSEKSEGSAFQFGESVVMTAASLVFDESTFSFATELLWIRERHRAIHEPVGEPARAVILMDGYTARREAEELPGTLSPASLALGVAALKFSSPKRFTGYLASDAHPHPWLESSVGKIAVGYPSRLPDASVSGRMHQSTVSALPLHHIAGGLYAAAEFEGGEGMAGAPLMAAHSDGRFYPAGVFVGGAGRAVVRSIDSEVLRLAFLAANQPEETRITISGGVTLTSWAMGAVQDPAALQANVRESFAGSTGRWKIGATGSLRRSGDSVGGLAAGSKRIFFPPAIGRVAPGFADPAVSGGGYVDVDLASGRRHVLEVDYAFIESSPTSQTVTAFQNTWFGVMWGSFPPQQVEWYHDGVLLPETGPFLNLAAVTSADEGTYVAKVIWGTGSLWSEPAVLTLQPASQTIQWQQSQMAVIESLPLDLAATASSGLGIHYEVISGPAMVSGASLIPNGVGTVMLQASQEGNSNHAPATPVIWTFDLVASSLASWRYANFGTDANSGNAADNADPDGDGQSNRSEYAAGTHPKDAADRFRILTNLKNASGYVVTASGKATRSYVLERKENPDSGSWESVDYEGPLSTDGTVEMMDSSPPPNKAFYRMRVTAP